MKKDAIAIQVIDEWISKYQEREAKAKRLRDRFESVVARERVVFLRMLKAEIEAKQ
jgi:hypothetical protein